MEERKEKRCGRQKDKRGTSSGERIRRMRRTRRNGQFRARERGKAKGDVVVDSIYSHPEKGAWRFTNTTQYVSEMEIFNLRTQ